MTAPTPTPSNEDMKALGIEPPPRDTAGWRNGLGVIALALGALALIAPLSRVEVHGRVGLLLVLAAVLEIAHGFRRSTPAGQRAAWFGGAITLAMGVLLVNAPYFAATAVVLFLAGWFGLGGQQSSFVGPLTAHRLAPKRRPSTKSATMRRAWSGPS